MPPFLALFLWFIALLWLLAFDPAKDGRISPALWLPSVWLALIGSRSPTQWFGLTTGTALTPSEDGNLLDHIVYLTLTFMALRVLVARHLNWRQVFARNSALLLFALFALLSVGWSDFPFASFRRWFRELGTYLMVLVVLSDTRPLEAIETVIRRFSYLLIPLSVVVIRYFREIGVGYNDWTGQAYFVGVTGGKNSLGALCLFSGLFFFWDTLRRWPNRRFKKTQRILLVNVAQIGMILWLLSLADSATSGACLLIGCLIVAAVQSSWGRANPNRLKVMIPAALIAGLLMELMFTTSETIAGLLGRDPTLTGRTEIWKTLLNMDTNPLFGVGYQSFWLGSRARAVVEAIKMGGLNEAHNGYLEMYLNLGLLGLSLLVGLLVASYRMLCRRLTVSVHFASISLAIWTIAVIYNVTERAFENSLPWFIFLLVAVAVPRSAATVSATVQPYRQPHRSLIIGGTR
jgi:exopolysaccharide production protein ExoQ